MASGTIKSVRLRRQAIVGKARQKSLQVSGPVTAVADVVAPAAETFVRARSEWEPDEEDGDAVPVSDAGYSVPGT